MSCRRPYDGHSHPMPLSSTDLMTWRTAGEDELWRAAFRLVASRSSVTAGWGRSPLPQARRAWAGGHGAHDLRLCSGPNAKSTSMTVLLCKAYGPLIWTFARRRDNIGRPRI
ncbi:hypothetical protein JX265_001918 [Neoarthrinium moseri]|uniref:Uncharacterized protein n=1 Tax=Neoarthrinium moseri TaxID=1658444 RepID=A0A9P9WW66_9PEZI|nr:hypothetical protein JX265_001918 [Neoarthrinium moseri]